ncbi:RsmB/NOP family class I SAM-dependent RNA methyltransferase [Cohnella caldifontis]|uniref:RsmB/NOP family class I SAM-dependent RNA methyltransferase n=1 Tax=Cohnella caldifontis TaxID=3027471 RepID=UPI0023EDB20F|nr:RsmB/NOP family class I SAM-dependent RNA methyltransferase [Cohnella sp. YIM B05605]
MKLPKAFIRTMRMLLQEEADAFFASYESPRTSGLRANGLKLAPERLPERSAMAGAPIPWAEGGYYTEEDDRPGKHPDYHLGLYYVQEPSAMLPAELLGVMPGHKVLDLCAAPGGKTTQLAAKLKGQGVLVTNDNAAERTKALTKNAELSGVRNAIVLNEEPERIAGVFGAWFDRVLVDAPCSGEGMFRKDESMVRQWERHTVESCALMQRDILRQAARLVAPGGRLAYSTCTFSPRENEGTIARFLAEFTEFRVVPADCDPAWGFGPGRPDWLDEEESRGLTAEQRESLRGAVRIWPHRSRGEGHFAVLLERTVTGTGSEVESERDRPASIAAKPKAEGRGKRGGSDGLRRAGGGKALENGAADVLGKFEAFRAGFLPDWQPPGELLVRGSSLYAVPPGVPPLHGLNAVRPGWLLGSATKHRFEPSQALAMGLREGDASLTLDLESGETDTLRYLKGETLQPPPGRLNGKGWTLVLVDGFPAGWGRSDGSTLKNERPPGWRWI